MDSRIHKTIDASLRIYAQCDEFWENLDLESWPDSSLKQIAIKVFKIPISAAAAKQRFSIFGICEGINETEQIYLSDIKNNLTIELELEYGVIYT
ncbi:45295_t:CDS:2 [Gigaspora margarita]|uniref:45295_t:CDS:1 n=1 Tax=Gigaspora margarita TaxID=4874 RepID=A0ABN7UHR8_GIGMA|nr:45295_t:CDS:2 [Gigaspora margarita]